MIRPKCNRNVKIYVSQIIHSAIRFSKNNFRKIGYSANIQKIYKNDIIITILIAVVKVYKRLLEAKLTPLMESTLDESQSGFRQGRNTKHYIFKPNTVINKMIIRR